MRALVPSNASYDFEAFNAAGQVHNGSAFVDYAVADYLSYRKPAIKQGDANDANIEAWHGAVAPAGTFRYHLRLRGASLALSPVMWIGEGPRETQTVVTDTLTALTVDKS